MVDAMSASGPERQKSMSALMSAIGVLVQPVDATPELNPCWGFGSRRFGRSLSQRATSARYPYDYSNKSRSRLKPRKYP
jgi:hypothetical protein